MSLDGVGLSLVNSKPDEMAYITLSRYVTKFLAIYFNFESNKYSLTLAVETKFH